MSEKTPKKYDWKVITAKGKSPYTRDELIAITVKIFNDMNDATKLQMATMFTDMALEKAKRDAKEK